MRVVSLALLFTALFVALAPDMAESQRRRPRRPRGGQAQPAEPTAPETPAVDPSAPPPATAPATPAPGAPATPPPAGGATPAGTPAPAAANPGQTAPPQAGAPAPQAQLAAPTDTPPGPITEVPPPPELPAGPDLGPLRAEYTQVMDDLVQTRGRIATLGRALFQTRMQIKVHNRTAGSQNTVRVVVSVDGAPVFTAENDQTPRGDVVQVYEGLAVPGPHVVVIELEQRARDGDTYRYTLRDSFRFEVARERLTEVTLTLDDGSNIAQAFPSGGEGVYDVHTRMRVATRALEASR